VTNWQTSPALDRTDLLAPATAEALRTWAVTEPAVAQDVLVFEIDPSLADTAALIADSGLDPADSVNCLVVIGRRDGQERIAAVCISADLRADVNGAVRKALEVRKATFMPMDRATSDTGMEYGGINPLGVPDGWRILVDSRAAARPGQIVVGSGLRRSKLLLPAALLARMPGVEVADLALPMT
jgi:prolyl-tRNA editing enzyme YbaK/EbsC (Cys-tRNA(Pro) deacylase)